MFIVVLGNKKVGQNAKQEEAKQKQALVNGCNGSPGRGISKDASVDVSGRSGLSGFT